MSSKHATPYKSTIRFSDMAFMAMHSLLHLKHNTNGLRFSILGFVRATNFHNRMAFSTEHLNSHAKTAVATEDAPSTVKKRNPRQVVVNTKWGERSVDPLYSDLLYSSEVTDSTS